MIHHRHMQYAPPGFPSNYSGMGAPGDDAGGINTTNVTIWAGLSVASTALCAYHGYKRNNSVGWAIAWGLLGGLFPIISPAVAVAQGFGKRA